MNEQPRAPIPAPTPEPGFAATPVRVSEDWKDAPVVVKGWAYVLTWLAIIVLPLVIVATFFMEGQDSAEKVPLALFYLALWGVEIWLNRALKKGMQAGWIVQIIISVLGLLAFPLGTLIHAYILSQWFKPETKAWFGQT